MDHDFDSLDDHSLTISDVDPEYEFDAARFFDFTRPESPSEAEEAQNWFPSTFATRLHRMEYSKLNNSDAPPKSNHGGNMTNICTATDVDFETQASVLYDNDRGSHQRSMTEDVSKDKTKSSAKSSKTKSSTFMKPTASHLAKINHAREGFGNHFGRSKSSSITSDDRSSQSSRVVEATKRQRLEYGYLCKVRPVDVSIINCRPKVTKPREPILETAIRAQRHRLKNTIENGERAKKAAHICKSSSFRHARKNTFSPVIQAFPLKNAKTRQQQFPSDVKTNQSCKPASRASVINALKMSCGDNTSKNCEYDIMKREAACLLDNEELTLLNEDNSFPHNPPPTELFGKLSLKSEPELITESVAKDYKENIPGCFNREIQN
ncbi:uncharacterized protein LOC124932938 [Impatiens glandulifera]|uniref:uncharacterized protein LOC124932938 n=1 Tax=Impatiens glandulifera TaxID=253017 RepID=UPI001FB110BB|nr:uncharacterized protein LOC124932938 [Impatiens glandulifera]